MAFHFLFTFTLKFKNLLDINTYLLVIAFYPFFKIIILTVIHVNAFFHLFQEEGQLQAARALATLLSPEKGSFIFGSHSAQQKKGIRSYPNPRGEYIFCHNLDSWRELWDGTVFKKGTVKVNAELVERPWRALDIKHPGAEDERRYMMVWKIKRI